MVIEGLGTHRSVGILEGKDRRQRGARTPSRGTAGLTAGSEEHPTALQATIHRAEHGTRTDAVLQDPSSITATMAERQGDGYANSDDG